MSFITVILLTSMGSSLYHLVFVYLLSYQIEVLHFAEESAFLINIIMLIIACMTFPIFGWLADTFNRFSIFKYTAAIFVLALF